MRRPSISTLTHSPLAVQVPTRAGPPGPSDFKASVILKHHHAVLLILLNTMSALLFKVLPAFVAYIKDDYGFTYSFTISAISIGSLATVTSFLIIPPLLHLPVNVVFFLSSMSQCLSCFLFWFFRDSPMTTRHIMFVIAVTVESLAQMITFGCSNAVISTFVSDPEDADIAHKYLSGINAGWTFATFLFFGVGYIMKTGDTWLFLEIMFVISLLMAILSVIFLPKLSTHRYNLNRSANSGSDSSSASSGSMWNDFAVLSKIKPFWLINISFILNFTAWGYFYSSFGLWLEGLFNLSEAQFGYIAGLCEGIGDAMADFTVAFLAKSNGNDTSPYKISLQSMMFWTALIGSIALGVIWIINFIGWYHQGFIYVVIGIFFFAEEACTNSGLIMICTVVPANSVGSSFAFIVIIQSLTIFAAQMSVSEVYKIGEMKFESAMLTVMFFMSFIAIVPLLGAMKKQHDGRKEDILLEQDSVHRSISALSDNWTEKSCN